MSASLELTETARDSTCTHEPRQPQPQSSHSLSDQAPTPSPSSPSTPAAATDTVTVANQRSTDVPSFRGHRLVGFQCSYSTSQQLPVTIRTYRSRRPSAQSQQMVWNLKAFPRHME